MASQGEPGSQRVEIVKYLQPFLRRRRQNTTGRKGKIGIGTGFGASDAAANLIELGEPEHICAMHD